jgi:nucleoid-associated protein YgaU
MKGKKRWVFPMVIVLALALMVLSSLSFSREVVAQVYPPQPPPPRTEMRPMPPASDYAWVPGHWEWNGYDWDWIPGYWRLAEGKKYIVQPGDTLSKIARRFLGTEQAWRDIAQLNNIDNPNRLFVGQPLFIP